MKMKVDPLHLVQAMNIANAEGLPHCFVQLGPKKEHGKVRLNWDIDGSSTPFEVELDIDGMWSVTLDYDLDCLVKGNVA